MSSLQIKSGRVLLLMVFAWITMKRWYFTIFPIAYVVIFDNSYMTLLTIDTIMLVMVICYSCWLFMTNVILSELFDHPIEIWSIDLVYELLASNSNI